MAFSVAWRVIQLLRHMPAWRGVFMTVIRQINGTVAARFPSPVRVEEVLVTLVVALTIHYKDVDFAVYKDNRTCAHLAPAIFSIAKTVPSVYAAHAHYLSGLRDAAHPRLLYSVSDILRSRCAAISPCCRSRRRLAAPYHIYSNTCGGEGLDITSVLSAS